MNALDPRTLVTDELLARALPQFLQVPSVRIRSVDATRLKLGTSGARLDRVTVKLECARPDVELILKVSPHGSAIETHFYQELAPLIPLGTPFLIGSGIVGDRGWVLLESVTARDPLTWRPEDYRVVVEDMARLHAAYWSATKPVERSWMPATSVEALQARAASLQQAVDVIEGSWLMTARPQMFPPHRLEHVRLALAALETITDPLRKAGLTFVHGDYWFFNALLTEGGRRCMVDWQSPMIWSGLWELAYFMNLLSPVGEAGYREMPLPEEIIVACYRDAIRRHGVDIVDEAFDRALMAGRITQPMFHWLPQLARAATAPGWRETRTFEQAVRFQRRTFDLWEADMRSVGYI